MEIFHADELDRGHALAPSVGDVHAPAQPARDGGGPDANVIALHPEPVRKRSSGDIGPVLDPLVPAVGERESEVSFLAAEEFGRGNERHDLDPERERADAGILFPAVLWTDRAVRNEIAGSARDHCLGATYSAERILLRELGRENDGKADLVELNAGPEWLAGWKPVLVPGSVCILNRDEIGQDVTAPIDASDAQECERRFHAIARPDEMIAAKAVARISPRHAQARDHRAGIATIFMHFQNDGREIGLAPDLGRRIRNGERFRPLLPSLGEFLAYRAVSFA